MIVHYRQNFLDEIRRTEMHYMLFSALTYNPAAIHIDHAYAAPTRSFTCKSLLIDAGLAREARS